MKKLSLLLAIIIAVIATSCTSDGYKSYVPGDSKVVGKVDLKAFFEQTGVDQDKLMKDIIDQYGDDAATMKEMGVDPTAPIYIFGRGKGTDINFGLVAKVKDRAMAEKWVKDNAKMGDLNNEGNYSVAAESEAAIAINDDAVVLLSATTRDKDALKRSLRKIMEKEEESNIDDNKLFAQADGAGSFACLYADLSMIPSELASMAQSQTGVPSENIEDLRKMIIGFDATSKDGICDIESWCKSDDKDMQEKIDKTMNAFGRVSDKALKSFSANDVFGLALNTDGSQLAGFIKEAAQKSGQAEMLGEIIEKVCAILNKIKGNVLCTMQMPGNFVFAAEGKNCTEDVASLLKDMGLDRSYDFDMGTTTSGLTAANNGYCMNGSTWFGYKGGNFFVTNNEELSAEPLKDASDPISSTVTDLMKDRRTVVFANIDKLKSFSAQIDDKDSKQAMNAFAEVLDKVKFVTLSYK